MNRPLTILSTAVLAIGTANAQSVWQTLPVPPAGNSVSIYGLLDTGIEHLSTTSGSHQAVTRMPGLSGTFPSRVGFRGREELGGGLAAIYTFESGFGVDSGVSNQGSRLFGRQAWVGMTGPWGAVMLGRNYTMLYWGLFDGDEMGPDAYGLASQDNYIPNERADNSVAWKAVVGGFTLGATYSLGRDTVNAGPSPAGANCAGENHADAQACREWSGMIKYDSSRWGAALVTDELHGGTGAFAGLTKSGSTDQRTSLNGYFKVSSVVKLTAGDISRRNDGAAPVSVTNGATRRSNLYWLGAAWNLSPAFLLDGQVQRLAFRGGDKSTLSVARGIYSLSKRTAVYVQGAHISNGSRLVYSVSSAATGNTPGPGQGQTGFYVGMRHSF